MSPYYGDHIKKEREALNLIIRMKRANQRSHTGELIFFIVVPVAMAFAVMHFQDILLFCYKTQWASPAMHRPARPHKPLSRNNQLRLPPVKARARRPAELRSEPLTLLQLPPMLP